MNNADFSSRIFMSLQFSRIITPIAIVLLGLPLVLYGWSLSQRPARVPLEKPLFQGISYRRVAQTQPRPLMIHIVKIDLTRPGIRAVVTPGQTGTDLRETHARTTSAFLREFGLQLAVNANFFYPFWEAAPWDYYPHPGDRTNAVGLAISDGYSYSPSETNWVALCFLATQQAQISANGSCPLGTRQAVAGSTHLVAAGKVVPIAATSADNDGLYSRTAVGLDARGNTLWIVVIDDKQPDYSEGVSLLELSNILVSLGVNSAINLDGGGSTTLVMASPHAPVILNAPIHTKVPMRERPVANHLGFYARPIAD